MLFALLERFASCGWAGVGQGLRVRRRDLWILGDFCLFSGIFGKMLTDFIYFDKEKKVQFSSEFFIPELWPSAHWGKKVWGTGEQI